MCDLRANCCRYSRARNKRPEEGATRERNYGNIAAKHPMRKGEIGGEGVEKELESSREVQGRRVEGKEQSTVEGNSDGNCP